MSDIRYALLHHKVIFFRGQHHLDDAEHEAFAELLGTPVAHPTLASAKGTSYILELDAAHGGRANEWHTDVTFVDRHPAASILRALVVPSYGGDTVWANTATAYNDLTTELRDVADRLWAVHSNAYDYAAVRPESSAEDRQRFAQTFASTVYETEHPVVRFIRRPANARCCSAASCRSCSASRAKTRPHLYTLLQSRVTRLENTVRWRWAAGDVAIWDNRATQHYAINDYGDQRRVMHAGHHRRRGAGEHRRAPQRRARPSNSLTGAVSIVADPVPPKLPNAVVQRIAAVIAEVRYGTVEITIHDGRVVQIQRKERFRYPVGTV